MLSVLQILKRSGFGQLQKRTLFRELGYESVPEDHEQVTPDNALRIWVYLLLQRLPYLSPEQRAALFSSMLPELTGVGDVALSAVARSNGPTLLVIGDTQYATWTGMKGYLDLTTGSLLQQPPHAILESVAYNLDVLFARNYKACQG